LIVRTGSNGDNAAVGKGWRNNGIGWEGVGIVWGGVGATNSKNDAIFNRPRQYLNTNQACMIYIYVYLTSSSITFIEALDEFALNATSGARSARQTGHDRVEEFACILTKQLV
jgi:hypothetical protein